MPFSHLILRKPLDGKFIMPISKFQSSGKLRNLLKIQELIELELGLSAGLLRSGPRGFYHVRILETDLRNYLVHTNP